MHKHVVSVGGHTIKEMKRRVRANKILFGGSGIATWKVEKLHSGINEMPKYEIKAILMKIIQWFR
jgi:hypothetical protein